MSAVPVGTLRAPELRPGLPIRIPRLQIVRSPSGQRSLLPFASLCLVILAGALLGALMLNTSMATTSYEMHDQRAELARLSEHSQALSQRVDRLSSPASLAAAAERLGMERAEEASFLTLADGSVHGPAASQIGQD